MPDLHGTAIFCDDVREELGGLYSLIGVYGDNVKVPSFPGAMAKLGIYVRLNVSQDFGPCDVDLILIYPDGEEQKATTFSRGMIESAISDAREAENPIAGLYSHLVAAPFNVRMGGRYAIELRWGDQRQRVGGIRFLQADDAVEEA